MYMCSAYHQDFVWPCYAWIHVEFKLLSDEIVESTDRCSEDMMNIAIEKTL